MKLPHLTLLPITLFVSLLSASCAEMAMPLDSNASKKRLDGAEVRSDTQQQKKSRIFESEQTIIPSSSDSSSSPRVSMPSEVHDCLLIDTENVENVPYAAALDYLRSRHVAPNKLELLVFCAQGYFRALYGIPLVTHVTFNLHATRLWAEKENSDDESDQESGELQAIHKEVLDTVLSMYASLEAPQIFALLQEKGAAALYHKDDSQVELSSMLDFFSSAKLMIPFFIEWLTVTDTTLKGRTKIIDLMRRYISYWCPEQDLQVVINACTISQHSLNQLYPSTGNSWKYGPWSPAESGYDTFMGHLMFPVQFELWLDEIPETLCCRSKIQTMLAYAARFNNPLAHAFMNYVIKHLRETIVQLDAEGDADTFYQVGNSQEKTPFLPEHISQSIAQVVVSRRGPAYFAAHLAHQLGDEQAALEYLTRVPCVDEVGYMRLHQSFDHEAFKHYAKENGGYAAFLQAGREGNREQRKQLFSRAAQLGVPQAFIELGTLAAQEQHEDEAIKAFIQAGRHGLLNGYRRVAELYIQRAQKAAVEKDKQAHLRLAAHYYFLQGTWGDERGYRRAAEILCLIDINEAPRCYNQAGLECYPTLPQLPTEKRDAEWLGKLIARKETLERTANYASE